MSDRKNIPADPAFAEFIAGRCHGVDVSRWALTGWAAIEATAERARDIGSVGPQRDADGWIILTDAFLAALRRNLRRWGK